MSIARSRRGLSNMSKRVVIRHFMHDCSQLAVIESPELDRKLVLFIFLFFIFFYFFWFLFKRMLEFHFYFLYNLIKSPIFKFVLFIYLFFSIYSFLFIYSNTFPFFFCFFFLFFFLFFFFFFFSSSSFLPFISNKFFKNHSRFLTSSFIALLIMSAKIEFIKTPAAPKPPVASTKTGVRTTDVSILLYWPLILDFFINPSIGPKLVVLFCFFLFCSIARLVSMHVAYWSERLSRYSCRSSCDGWFQCDATAR